MKAKILVAGTGGAVSKLAYPAVQNSTDAVSSHKGTAFSLNNGYSTKWILWKAHADPKPDEAAAFGCLIAVS